MATDFNEDNWPRRSGGPCVAIGGETSDGGNRFPLRRIGASGNSA